MKICPTCRKTYSDDGLNFCLDDGSVLTLASDNNAQTVMMNQPPFTDPNPAQGVRTSYGDQAGYSMQPQKSLKVWMWVLGLLGLLVLVCGGGLGAFFIYVASITPDGNKTPTPSPTRQGGTPSPTPFPRDQVQSIDLESWVRANSDFGNTSYSDGEFLISSKKKGFYYVVAATDEYKTELASTSVVVRNVNDASSSLGYGLVFHSDPRPLQKGYAFIIDSKRQRYRVVRHEPGKEIDVVNWTNSSAIKPGSAENKLEVRDSADRVELYINGELVTSIKNTHGHRGGVVGLYSGDAVSVAFKDLEIAK